MNKQRRAVDIENPLFQPRLQRRDDRNATHIRDKSNAWKHERDKETETETERQKQRDQNVT